MARAWALLSVLCMLLAHAPVAALWAQPGASERRVALVIGNAAYQHDRTLNNPRNDAADVAAALRRIGFQDVALHHDLTVDGMRAALRGFAERADRADVALVYFAGHGMEAGGRNWLIPVDARLRRDRDLDVEAIALDTVLRMVENARALRLVILDACRDNPLAQRAQRTDGLSRSVARGLARVEPVGATFVAFAAREGTLANDGEGRNSPYAAALLRNLERPGLPLERLFGAVREDVLETTGRRQEPFLYGSSGRDPIYLAPSSAPAVGTPPPSAPVDQSGIELEFWRSIQNSRNAAEFEAYLSRYPNGAFAPLARARIDELRRAQTPARPADPPLAALPPAPRRGASFDCGRAQRAEEIVICGDAETADSDGRMGEAYRAALAAAPDAQRQQLQRDQRDWLVRRSRDCGMTATTFVTAENRWGYARCLARANAERAVYFDAFARRGR